jgi:TonB family protein
VKRILTGLLLIGVGVSVPLYGIAQQRDRAPTWVIQPTPAELSSVYPAAAVRSGVDGDVLLDCLVGLDRTISDCKVEKEVPKDLGFGTAALVVIKRFSMNPAIRNGRPTAERTKIPIAILGGGTPTGSNMKGTDSLGRQKIVNNVAWLKSPSYADVAAAYPERLRQSRQSARATLACTFTAEGKLTACSVQNELPVGTDVAPAVRKLIDSFQAPPSVTTPLGEVPVAGLAVEIPVSFSERMLESDRAPIIGSPPWSVVPSSADFGAAFPAQARSIENVNSRVVLQCTVAQGGVLDGCRVSSETPPGMGFGAAALTLAQKFRVAPWSAEGVPTVGSSVRLPIVYNSSTGSAPAAAPAPG